MNIKQYFLQTRLFLHLCLDKCHKKKIISPMPRDWLHFQSNYSNPLKCMLHYLVGHVDGFFSIGEGPMLDRILVVKNVLLDKFGPFCRLSKCPTFYMDSFWGWNILPKKVHNHDKSKFMTKEHKLQINVKMQHKLILLSFYRVYSIPWVMLPWVILTRVTLPRKPNKFS